MNHEIYNPLCQRCDRLSAFLARVKEAHPTYVCRPVPPFGVASARLLVVGLAPGMHGANATGRPFTGDHAGILLYQTLFDFGFASRPISTAADDGLQLIDCRITNAVKCLPPDNKPMPIEMRTCNDYLRHDLAMLADGAAILALGRIAHDAVMLAFALRAASHRFAHGSFHTLPRGIRLFDCYHCSRYNTNTRRLTPEMFREVFAGIVSYLALPSAARARVSADVAAN